jgi:uncharacterized damage-inducible protein DinB
MQETPPVLAEPSRASGEIETLTAFIEYYRAVLVRKSWGLDHTQLHSRVAASSLTIGSLLKHMALVEDHWFQDQYLGRDLPEPWASAPFDDDPDWEMSSAVDDSLDELLDQFSASCARSRRAISSATPEDRCARSSPETGEPINLRWVMVHMIEEYARHCGHADLVREAIDGQVGD